MSRSRARTKPSRGRTTSDAPLREQRRTPRPRLAEIRVGARFNLLPPIVVTGAVRMIEFLLLAALGFAIYLGYVEREGQSTHMVSWTAEQILGGFVVRYTFGGMTNALIGGANFDGAGSATAALYGVPGRTDLDGAGSATAARYDSDVDAATIIVDMVMRPMAPGLTNRAVRVTVLAVTDLRYCAFASHG
jgi:hypothetical protein